MSHRVSRPRTAEPQAGHSSSLSHQPGARQKPDRLRVAPAGTGAPGPAGAAAAAAVRGGSSAAAEGDMASATRAIPGTCESGRGPGVNDAHPQCPPGPPRPTPSTSRPRAAAAATAATQAAHSFMMGTPSASTPSWCTRGSAADPTQGRHGTPTAAHRRHGVSGRSHHAAGAGGPYPRIAGSGPTGDGGGRGRGRHAVPSPPALGTLDDVPTGVVELVVALSIAGVLDGLGDRETMCVKRDPSPVRELTVDHWEHQPGDRCPRPVGGDGGPRRSGRGRGRKRLGRQGERVVGHGQRQARPRDGQDHPPSEVRRDDGQPDRLAEHHLREVPIRGAEHIVEAGPRGPPKRDVGKDAPLEDPEHGELLAISSKGLPHDARVQCAHVLPVGHVGPSPGGHVLKGCARVHGGHELRPGLEERPQVTCALDVLLRHALQEGGRAAPFVPAASGVKPAVDMERRVGHDAQGPHRPLRARGPQAPREGQRHEGDAQRAEAGRGDVDRQRGRVEGRRAPGPSPVFKHPWRCENPRGRIGPLCQNFVVNRRWGDTRRRSDLGGGARPPRRGGGHLRSRGRPRKHRTEKGSEAEQTEANDAILIPGGDRQFSAEQ